MLPTSKPKPPADPKAAPSRGHRGADPKPSPKPDTPIGWDGPAEDWAPPTPEELAAEEARAFASMKKAGDAVMATLKPVFDQRLRAEAAMRIAAQNLEAHRNLNGTTDHAAAAAEAVSVADAVLAELERTKPTPTAAPAAPASPLTPSA